MNKPFEPMLAGTPKPGHIYTFPLLASPKLDGVRAVSRGGVLLSRSLKPIPNQLVQYTLSKPEFNGLDGELTCGPANAPNVMQATMSGVMARDKTAAFQFHVFDDVSDPPEAFSNRLTCASLRVHRILKNWPEAPIVMVPHTTIFSLEELDAYEAEQLAAGYEGVMIRSLDGEYKYGRSTPREGALLKLKRFVDGEAVIVGFEEEMENRNEKTVNEKGRSKRSTHQANKVGKGTLGAFVVRMYRGGEEVGPRFNIGSGINEFFADVVWANRAEYLNRIVKFKHFDHGVVDAPRHPVFLGMRDEKDMS